MKTREQGCVSAVRQECALVGSSSGDWGERQTGRLVRRLPQFTKGKGWETGLKWVIAVKWERNRCKGKN